MFEGLRAREGRGVRHAARSRRRHQQRLDQPDRTNYYIDVPSNALELALFLESDRMGYLLDAMSPERVNGQRDVVKNERRQSYENAPYGMASIEIDKMLYPEGHPYRWPTIGYMEDLTAASYEDVVDFFKKYYQPANASLVIAGDIDPAQDARAGREVVRRRQARRAAGAADRLSAPKLTEVKRKTIQDRVQLPRLYLSWLTPSHFEPGDAELDVRLAGARGRQELAALQAAGLRPADRAGRQRLPGVGARSDRSSRSSSRAARRAAAPRRSARSIASAPSSTRRSRSCRRRRRTAREFERAINQIEASFYNRMEQRRRIRGRRRPAERVLLRDRQSRITSTRTCRATARCRPPTSRRRRRSGCRRTGASS